MVCTALHLAELFLELQANIVYDYTVLFLSFELVPPPLDYRAFVWISSGIHLWFVWRFRALLFLCSKYCPIIFLLLELLHVQSNYSKCVQSLSACLIDSTWLVFLRSDVIICVLASNEKPVLREEWFYLIALKIVSGDIPLRPLQAAHTSLCLDSVSWHEVAVRFHSPPGQDTSLLQG